MIVICTNCQAKFRVPDDRIGARGAKVRCSRCRTIFHVLAEPAPAAEAPQDVPPSAAPRDMHVELENPFAAKPHGDPFAAAVPPPLPVRAEPDPFAVAAAAPPLAVPAEPDPFEAAAPPPLPGRSDPFAGDAPAADDPFAAHAPASDPFASPPPEDFEPVAGPVPHAATDLSDLVDSPGPAELGAPPELGLDPGVHLSAPDPEPDDGGLALEERSPIAPPSVAPLRPPLEPGGGIGPAQSADAFVMPGDPKAFEAYDFGPGSGPALALETGPLAAAVPAPGPAAPAAAPTAAMPAHVGEASAPRPDAPEPAGPAKERLAQPRRSRLRAAALNTLALAVLLAVTLGILVVWRSDGAIDALSSLRPDALLAALGRGGAASPFAAVDVRSGVYEREKGPPVLFVRGKVISRAPAAVRAVKVLVEVTRGDGVVARGEALAGAVPTPEELYQLGDGPALAGLAEAAARRAPREIRPGDAVPFLVAIADAPADLDGASVRVEVASAEAPRR